MNEFDAKTVRRMVEFLYKKDYSWLVPGASSEGSHIVQTPIDGQSSISYQTDD